MKKFSLFSILIIILLPSLACGKNRKKASGKMVAPVILEYTAPQVTQKGAVATIKITGYPQADAESFSLSVDLPKGVKLVEGETKVQGGEVKARQRINGAFQVRADDEGRYTLPLTGFITFNGQKQARVIPIYFQVGEKQKNDATTGTLSPDKKYNEIEAQ